MRANAQYCWRVRRPARRIESTDRVAGQVALDVFQPPPAGFHAVAQQDQRRGGHRQRDQQGRQQEVLEEAGHAQACAEDAADALAHLLDEHAGEICALVLEPLVQCAGGMRMHHPAYLRRARELCDVHGIFLIADEIAVGFGRTGTMFACEQAGVQPDLLCLSKGLTGGFLPLAAVLATQAIYDGFLDASRERAFLHSHSYTGNPLACAAALASLDIFGQDNVLERNRASAARMAALAAPIRGLPHVADVRQAGMIVAFELCRDGDRRAPFDPALRIGLRAYRAALARGVLLRPLGDVLYWMPPYCIDDAQLALLADATVAAIAEATACA